MSTYTVAYQPQLDGFTSFFSFVPEWAIGMNNYLYTFKNGQIYKHYVNPLRNKFYGTTYDSTVDISFNDAPTEVKLFKTFSYTGNYPVESLRASFKTYLSNRWYEGEVAPDYFVNKEGDSYAFIRSTEESDFDSTMKDIGVGLLYSMDAPNNVFVVRSKSFITPPAVDPTSTGYGDTLYYIDSSGVQQQIGLITAYYQVGDMHTFYTDSVGSTPDYGQMMVISKNVTSESFGLRGEFMMSTITLLGTDKVEIFSVSSDILKSFP